MSSHRTPPPRSSSLSPDGGERLSPASGVESGIESGVEKGGTAPRKVGDAVQRCPKCDARYPAGIRFCPLDGVTLVALHLGVDTPDSAIAGRYQLERKLGEGGMGLVFLARDLRLHRQCAIKLLQPRLVQDEDATRRFEREAENASRVQHPNLPVVFDYGTAEAGLQYIAMEFVDGETLRAILQREGPMDPGRALAIVEQVASALHALHERQIVHRDLKPDNILITAPDAAMRAVTPGGELVKVVDFGISRVVADPTQRVTLTGLTLGSPAYMSPEQWGLAPVDGRSDLYTLGCILYELVTGKPPHFDAARGEVDTTRRLTEKRPPRASDLRPGIPWAVDDIIAHTVTRFLDQRFQNAEALRAALVEARGALADWRPEPVADEPMDEPAWSERRALRSSPAALVLGGLLLLGAGGGAYYRFAITPAPAASVAETRGASDSAASAAARARARPSGASSAASRRRAAGAGQADSSGAPVSALRDPAMWGAGGGRGSAPADTAAAPRGAPGLAAAPLAQPQAPAPTVVPGAPPSPGTTPGATQAPGAPAARDTTRPPISVAELEEVVKVATDGMFQDLRKSRQYFREVRFQLRLLQAAQPGSPALSSLAAKLDQQAKRCADAYAKISTPGYTPGMCEW